MGYYSGDKVCYSCSAYSGRRYQNAFENLYDYCNGKVDQCEPLSECAPKKLYVRYEDTADRLYNGYKLRDGDWYGEEFGSGRYWQILPIGKDCCSCKCVCNHENATRSVRFFYTGELSIPDGFVVTGARFVKEYYNDTKMNVIFIQPQIAKLIDMARVNTTSAEWVDLPSHVKTEDVFNLQQPSECHSLVKANYEFKKKAYVTNLKFTHRQTNNCHHIHVDVIGREVSVDNDKLLGNRVLADAKDPVYDRIKLSDERLDAGQHVTALFDSQTVELSDPMPLVGLLFQEYDFTFDRRKSVSPMYPQLRTDNFADVFFT
jgi:hypothetical protein